MIQIRKFTKSYGDNVLFDNVDFDIDPKERSGLLAQNGKGKTTFFRCLSGEEDYEGTITVEGKLAVMEQHKEFENHIETFRNYLLEKQKKTKNKLAKLEEQFGDPTIYENTHKYNMLIYEYDRLCSRITEKVEYESFKKIWNALGYEYDLIDKPIHALSGGEQTALRLAEVLSVESDILLLDEPTNHLDKDAVSWLIEELQNKSVVVITHDRYFLDKIATSVIEIEDNDFVKYKCGYTQYLTERKTHREHMAQMHKATEKKRKELLESSEEKRKWALVNGNKSTRILADRLERFAENLPKHVDPKALVDNYVFDIKHGPSTSQKVFEIQQLSKQFGDKHVLDKFSGILSRGERIWLKGPNGAGKTTLLKMLAGILEADSGEVIRGENLVVGYYDQQIDDLPLNKSVMQYMLEMNPYLSDIELRNLALKFGFEHDIHKKKIKMYSGGEKSRLKLMHVLLYGYNVLLLDEPTNHLDLEIREALEAAVLMFPGTIVFSTHDRYFGEKIATRVITLQQNR